MKEHYIQQLQEIGYCLIPQVFSREQTRRGLELAKSWHSRTLASQSDRIPFLNKDQLMVYNLQAKDPYFLQILFSAPIMEELMMHFLNDVWFKSLPANRPNYILRSYLARSSNDQMPLHIDAFVPYSGPCVFVMQCSIVLEDQTVGNGSTVFVPGSHLRCEYATQEAMAESVPVESRAGDLVIWDSRVWHGAMANKTSESRWALIATFSRWWLKQAFDIPGNLPQEIYADLTDAQKAVLGYCSVPYDDETIGIDMKRSYELLPQYVADYRK